MRRIFPLVVLVATLPLGAAMTAASASQDRPSISIIHGLPGFTADIYLDDELLLDGFRPTQATDPMKLDRGHLRRRHPRAGRARRLRAGPVRQPHPSPDEHISGGRAPRRRTEIRP